MPIYRRRNSPYYWFDIKWRGRRLRGSTGQKERRAAERVEAKKRRELILGDDDRSALTLDVAAQQYWIEVAEDQPSAATTEYQLGNLVDMIGPDILLAEVNDAVVSSFVQRRRGQVSRNGRRVSSASVNREVELLRRVMYRARKHWRAQIGEVDWKAQKLVEPDPPAPVLTAAQEARLYDELADHLKAPYRFALMTGLRLRNVIGLDWSQVDLHGRTMTFRLKSQKPGGRVHVLPITDAVLVLLANQGPQDAGPVFMHKGRPIKTLKTAWNAAKRRAGIANLRWHDLRHVAGSRIARTHGLLLAKEVLGHADISTTLRYAHAVMDDKRRALEALSSHTMATPADVHEPKPLTGNG